MAGVVTRRAALGGLLVVPALAGCSGPEDPGPATAPPPTSTPSATVTGELPPTAQAYRDTRTFALAAESGRARGAVRRGGDRVDVDLAGDAAGSNQHVVVEGTGVGLAEVLTVDDRHWLAGDLDFWRSRGLTTARARTATSGWLAVTPAQARAVAPWTLRTLLTDRFSLPAVAALESDSTPVGEQDVDGRRLWVLGSRGSPRLWVVPDGSAELVRLVVPGGTDLTFSRWGRVEPLPAPDPGTVRTT